MTTSELYTQAWHEWHKWTNAWSTRALFGVFAHLGVPRRMLDVGCADGHLVKIAANLCAYAEGYDIAAVEQHRHNYDIGQYDLTRPLATVHPFDLVISWEVAEHLPADSADTFCDTLVNNLEDGGHLVFTAAIPGQGGHGHINCLVGDTRVDLGAAKTAMRRWYSGEVLAIKTSTGNELTVTPNHPIFTNRGWLAAQAIYEALHERGGLCTDRIALGVMPDNDYVPPSAEEIFESLNVSMCASSHTMPTTAEDFHGDGINGEVEVVRPYRSLLSGGDTFIDEHREKYLLFGRNAVQPGFVGSGSSVLSFQRVTGSLSGLGERPRNQEPFFIGHAAKSQRVPFLSSSDLPSGAQDGVFDGTWGTTGRAGEHESGFARLVTAPDKTDIQAQLRGGGLFIPDLNAQRNKPALGGSEVAMSQNGEGSQGFAGQITFDEVCAVERSDFVGHVYNFETEKGWYIANGIVTHNCQPHSYWREKLEARGLTFQAELTEQIRTTWKMVVGPCWWYSQNIQAFRR